MRNKKNSRTNFENQKTENEFSVLLIRKRTTTASQLPTNLKPPNSVPSGNFGKLDNQEWQNYSAQTRKYQSYFQELEKSKSCFPVYWRID